MRRVLAAVLACAWAIGASAQDEDAVLQHAGVGPVAVTPGKVVVRVRPFADGLVRGDSRTAIRVTLANGASDGEAVIAYEANAFDETIGTYRRRVDLARGSRKDVWLVVTPGIGGSTRSAQVLFGREALSVEYAVTALGEGDVGIAVLGDETLGVAAVTDAWIGPVPGRHVRTPVSDDRKVRMALVPYDGMPESPAPYETVDWVVWSSPEPVAVDPRSFDALRAWVADGGHLVVAVTDTWRAVEDSPLGDMLPVDLVGMEDRTDVGRLVQILGGRQGEAVSTPVARAVVRDVPGRSTVVLASAPDPAGDVPLWVAGSYGLGTVHVLLADPMLEPLSTGVPREEFWRRLLWLPAPSAVDGWLWRDPDESWDANRWSVGSYGWYFGDYSAHGPAWRRLMADLDLAAPQASDFYVEGDSHYVLASAWVDGTTTDRWEARVRQYLSEIPGVAPLPLSWLLVFSGLYLFAIGPLDWFVLRALKRPVWTWVTFPITIAVFSAVALIGTSRIKGNQAVLTRFEVVDVLTGTGLWRGDAYVGVWATRKSDLVLKPGVDLGDARPLRDHGAMWDAEIRSTEGGGEMSWRAETWTLAYARSSWTAPNEGTAWIEPLASGGWRIHNDLGVSLARANLVVADVILPLGPLGRGGTVDIPGPPQTGFDPDAIERAVTALGTAPTQELDTGTQAPTPYFRHGDSGDVLSLEWAEHTALEHPESGRGHLDLYGHIALVGCSQAPQTPLDLSGLDPVTRSVTVYRVPLAPGGSR